MAKKDEDKLPTRVFKMKEEQDIRDRSRRVLRVALFLKEIGFPVRNYCSLNEEMARILDLEMDNDKGLLEIKNTGKEDFEKVTKYLEERNIDILEKYPFTYDGGLEVNRYIIRITSIGSEFGP